MTSPCHALSTEKKDNLDRASVSKWF